MIVYEKSKECIVHCCSWGNALIIQHVPFRYSLCSDPIKRCTGVMLNNELLLLKWENKARFPALPRATAGENGSRDTMSNPGAHRRMSVGKPTVVSMKIPHMPDVAYMFDDSRCILYHNYGDMYAQVHCHVVGCDV